MSDVFGLQHHNSPIDVISKCQSEDFRLLKVNTSCLIYLIYRFANEAVTLERDLFCNSTSSQLPLFLCCHWRFLSTVTIVLGIHLQMHVEKVFSPTAARCISVGILICMLEAVFTCNVFNGDIFPFDYNVGNFNSF